MDPPRLCLNCEQPLLERYCSHCGQDSRNHARSLGGVLHELVESLIHLDSAFWRTLRPLLLKPGEVSYQYLRGRRACYTPPFRLYVLVSLAFFAAVSNTNHLRAVSFGTADEDISLVRFSGTHSCQETAARLKLTGWLRSGYVDNCEQAHVDGGRELSRALWEAIPKAFFLLVPVFALLTRILFAREGRFYVEHLVFITYLHSGLFLAGTLIALASLLIGFAPTSMTHLAGVTQVTLSCVLVLYGCVYIVRAVRRVFQQAWWLTLVKSVVLLGAYAFLVTLSLVGVIVLTLGTR